MIIVYYTRKGPIVQVFVANLKEDKPDINQIYFMNDDGLKQEDKEKSHGTVKILPGKDRFYIIEIYYEKNRNKIQVSCQYEYVYQSGALTQSNISTVYVKSNINSFEQDNDMTPVFFNAVKSDNGSIWIFSGNRVGASSLLEVTVAETGQFTVVEQN